MSARWLLSFCRPADPCTFGGRCGDPIDARGREMPARCDRCRAAARPDRDTTGPEHGRPGARSHLPAPGRRRRAADPHRAARRHWARMGVTPWGPGPGIAGHATVYHVITYHDEICAEVAPRMQPSAPWCRRWICRHARARAGWRLWAHSVRDIRRGRLADAGRENRPSDLRDQGDPVRLHRQASCPRPATAG